MPAPMAKYSVSIPREIAEEARARAGASGFSAYVTAAVERALERERLREIIEAAEAEHGPITEEEIAAAERMIEDAHRAVRHRAARRGAA